MIYDDILSDKALSAFSFFSCSSFGSELNHSLYLALSHSAAFTPLPRSGNPRSSLYGFFSAIAQNYKTIFQNSKLCRK